MVKSCHLLPSPIARALTHLSGADKRLSANTLLLELPRAVGEMSVGGCAAWKRFSTKGRRRPAEHLRVRATCRYLPVQNRKSWTGGTYPFGRVVGYRQLNYSNQGELSFRFGAARDRGLSCALYWFRQATAWGTRYHSVVYQERRNNGHGFVSNLKETLGVSET